MYRLHRVGFVVLALLMSGLAHGQAFNAYRQQTFTGAASDIALLQNTTISYHQLSWTPISSPSPCTASVDSSVDGTTWTTGGIIPSQSCLTPGTSTIVNTSANYIRLTVLTFGGGGASVVLTYKGWTQNPAGGGGGSLPTSTAAGLPFSSQANASTTYTTSPLYVDVSATAFTTGIAGDICKAMNNAMLGTAFNAGTTVLDLRAFSGVWACLTPPYHGINGTLAGNGAIILGGSNLTILTAVGIYTPRGLNSIEGAITGNNGATSGFRIHACGPLVPPGVTWNGTQCTITASGVVVPALTSESASYSLTFATIPRGPLPTGTYYCVICVGGQGTSEQQGWNSDSDAQHFLHLAVSTGGNSNTIGYYDPGSQERSEWLDFRIGCCGSGTNSTGFFFDRIAAPVNLSTSNAGVTRPVLRDGNMAGEMTAACTTCYFGIFEGQGISAIFNPGTCSVPPTAFVAQGQVNAGVITGVSIGNPGVCTVPPTTLTIYGASTTWNGAFNMSASVTPNFTAGALTSITVNSGGTNYPVATITGGPDIQMIAVAGGTTNTLYDGFVIDGVGVTGMKNIHNINGSGYVAEIGVYGAVASGVFENFDSSTAKGVHLGYMIDGGQAFFSIGGSSAVTQIQDDKYNLTVTTALTGRSVATYFPGSYLDSIYGFYIPEIVGTQPMQAGLDGFYGDAATHRIRMEANNTALGWVVGEAVQGTSGQPVVYQSNGYDVKNVAATAGADGVPQVLTVKTAAGVAQPATLSLPGVLGRSVTGSTATDTILNTDCAPNRVQYTTSVAVAVTLPSPTTLGVPQCVFKASNQSTAAVNDTFTSGGGWTINGAATLALLVGQQVFFYVDPLTASNWIADVTPAVIPYAVGGGTAQAQTVTVSPTVTALQQGLVIHWIPLAANTLAAPTLAVGTLTATAIMKCGAQALVANDINTSTIMEAVYDGTQFELINPQAIPCSQALGKYTVSGTGAVSRVSNIATVGSGVPILIYNTASAAVSANISSTQMTAGIAGTHQYRFHGYIDQVALGVTCPATASTIVLNLIFQDPLAAGTNTLPIIVFGPNTNTSGISQTTTIATSGAANGAAGQVVGSFTYSFSSKASIAINYSTSGYAGPAGCGTTPTYQVQPFLELVN